MVDIDIAKDQYEERNGRTPPPFEPKVLNVGDRVQHPQYSGFWTVTETWSNDRWHYAQLEVGIVRYSKACGWTYGSVIRS